jgi:hypothetical protein
MNLEKTFSPQRHRGTETSQTAKRQPEHLSPLRPHVDEPRKVSSVSLCLCGE